MFIVHVHCSLFMFIVHCSHGATLIFDDVFSLVPVSPGVVNQLTPDITDMASNHLSKTRPFLPLLYEIPEFWVRIDSIQLKEKVSVFMR